MGPPNKLGQFEWFKFLISDVRVYAQSEALNKLLLLFTIFLCFIALFLISIINFL